MYTEYRYFVVNVYVYLHLFTHTPSRNAMHFTLCLATAMISWRKNRTPLR